MSVVECILLVLAYGRHSSNTRDFLLRRDRAYAKVTSLCSVESILRSESPDSLDLRLLLAGVVFQSEDSLSYNFTCVGVVHFVII
jgi:hypothetical protein